MMYEKKISDTHFKKYEGRYFDTSWYDTILDSDAEGYYKENGIVKVLFKFKKNILSERLQELAKTTFLHLSKKKHSNRGIASGINVGEKNARHITKTGQNEGNYISSNISGYYDRPLREDKGKLGTNVACRTTAFTINNKILWNSGLPFIEKCSKIYKKLSLKHYLLQKNEYNKIKTPLKIPNSVFTTVTSNYNWRTACHKDTGDFSKGLGNLIVIGEKFTGGYLGFPQFKVLIKIKAGDFLLMDVHQYHCNTKIKENNGFRLSFVMYIREDMKFCKNKQNINNNIYYLS